MARSFAGSAAAPCLESSSLAETMTRLRLPRLGPRGVERLRRNLQDGGQEPDESARWLRTTSCVAIDAPAARCYEAYADLTRMPQWAPLLASVEFDTETRVSTWRLGVRGISVRWTAQNLEELPPRLLRWESSAGAQNFGAATFHSTSPGACTLNVTMTYKTPRAIAEIVEGPRVQDFIRRLLAATLARFKATVEREHAEAQTPEPDS